MLRSRGFTSSVPAPIRALVFPASSIRRRRLPESFCRTSLPCWRINGLPPGSFLMRKKMTPQIQAALDECRGIITKGSKSFSLAARLFDPATRDAAFFLYGWCRYCDDQVDTAATCETPDVVLDRVTSLKQRTAAASGFMPQTDPVFIALQYIARRYAIPAHYALELIEGMAMDARGTRYTTLKELLLYCYRVAGTVGLMMTHVMGVRDQRALRNATDLGIAMQLTNIARDIIEDAAIGRIYLPLAWLREAEIET